MNRDAKVTVIVPVYNEENYIHACIRSILKQTYRNLEIILINDGSTDRSGKIMNQLLKKDKRITILRHRNKGQAFSRNRGIAYATGEFVQFVDADDRLHPQMIEILVKQMEEPTDLVICGYRYGKKPITPHLTGTFPRQKFLNEFGEFYKAMLLPSPCNKLYRLELIRKYALDFPIYKHFGEDVLFNLDYMEQTRHITVIQDILYQYRRHRRSITNTYIPDMYPTHEQLYRRIQSFLSEQGKWKNDNEDIMSLLFAEGVIQAGTNLYHPTSPLGRKQACQMLEHLLSDPLVRSRLPYFQGSRQAKLFHHFISQRKYKMACRYLRVKKMLQRIPFLYPVLKKFNRRLVE